MAGGSDDDLDWLYRRNSHSRNVPDPGEHTRAMSEAEERALAARRARAERPQASPAGDDAWSGWPDPDQGAATPPRQAPDKPAQPARGGRVTFTESPSEPEPPRRQSFREPEPERRAGQLPPPAPGRRRPETPPPPARRRPEAPPPQARPRKRRHPVRTGLVTLLVLVLAVLGYLIGVPAVAWGKSSKVDDVPAGQRPAQQPGNLYLLVGSDSRAGLTKEQQRKLGTGSVEGARTDTMMLLYVPPSGQPALISIPRDSYVAIPGHNKNKINAAYSFDGPNPKLLEQTIEQNTGLRVDGYMEVGFGGFVNVIDAVGGIQMCPKTAIKDKDSHLDIPAGCQNMDGVTALGYVRMRKADPRGDLGRVERQREMLSALAKKVATPASVVNPVRYWKLNSSVASSIRTGQETSTFEVARMGLAMMSISRGDGLTLTVPIGNPNASTPAGSAVLWDEAKASQMFGQIAKGDTSKLKQFKTTN